MPALQGLTRVPPPLPITTTTTHHYPITPLPRTLPLALVPCSCSLFLVLVPVPCSLTALHCTALHCTVLRVEQSWTAAVHKWSTRLLLESTNLPCAVKQVLNGVFGVLRVLTNVQFSSAITPMLTWFLKWTRKP